jgi:hypothetical protein
MPITIPMPKVGPKAPVEEHECPQSLLQGVSRFDYSQLKSVDAKELHAAAVRIRGRSSKSLVEDGRDFIRIKDLLPHGDWTGWMAGEEIPYNMKMVQRAMSVARLCDGRSKHLEALAVSVRYDLAAKSVPDAVKDRVSDEADKLGNAPDAQWVWKQIYDAKAKVVDPVKEVAKFAAPDTKAGELSSAAKAAAVSGNTVSQVVEDEADQQVEPPKTPNGEIAKVNAVALIVEKLPTKEAHKLADCCEAAGWHDLAERLSYALDAKEAA